MDIILVQILLVIHAYLTARLAKILIHVFILNSRRSNSMLLIKSRLYAILHVWYAYPICKVIVLVVSLDIT